MNAGRTGEGARTKHRAAIARKCWHSLEVAATRRSGETRPRSGVTGLPAVAAGQLMDRVEGQEDADDEETEAAPILEVVVPAGRHDQRRDRERAQQKEDANLR